MHGMVLRDLLVFLQVVVCVLAGGLFAIFVVFLASWLLNVPAHARGPHLVLSLGPISVHEDSIEKAAEKLERRHRQSRQHIVCYASVPYFQHGSSLIFLCLFELRLLLTSG